jgi:hypothetical protein
VWSNGKSVILMRIAAQLGTSLSDLLCRMFGLREVKALEGAEDVTKVSLGFPSPKIAGKRPVDDGRMAFPGAVRLPLHGVDIALLDMIGLPGQLAVWGLILLGQELSLLPPVRNGLEVWPERREFLQQSRAGDYWRGLDARRVPWIARLWGRLEAIRGLRGRRQQGGMLWEVLREWRGRRRRRGLRYSAPGGGARWRCRACRGLPSGMTIRPWHGIGPHLGNRVIRRPRVYQRSTKGDNVRETRTRFVEGGYATA